jgi:hypothetical protein
VASYTHGATRGYMHGATRGWWECASRDCTQGYTRGLHTESRKGAACAQVYGHRSTRQVRPGSAHMHRGHVRP